MTPPTRSVRPPELDQRPWLRRAYIINGRSARSIAEQLGCSDRIVLAALHRLDIPTRPKRPVAPDTLSDHCLLLDMYWGKSMSIASIGDHLGCSAGAVRQALHRHGIEVRAVGRTRIGQLYDPDWLRQARERWTSAEIAVLLECSEKTVRWAMWRSRIPPGAGTPPRPRQLDDVAFLLREYVMAKRSATSIALEVGCSTATVLHAIRRQGLAVRSATRQAAIREAAIREPQEEEQELEA